MQKKAKGARKRAAAQVAPVNARMWTKALKRIMKTLAAATLVVGVLVALHTLRWWPFDPPTGQELANKYDNTNPSLECAGDGRDVTTLNSKSISSDIDGARLAIVEVRYSPACKTSWLRVITSMDGGTVVKMASRKDAGGVPSATVVTEDPPGSGEAPTYESFSDQLYSAGCLEVSTQLFNVTGVLVGEMRPTEVC
ncbi:DUF2690 domain-containing protein [Clavibacter michiganensis]|uniref:DUF2690 domain-containing protein n=1 Tax=Clavibacter michiganensis TaxID=28447 RepID=UPI001303A118